MKNYFISKIWLCCVGIIIFQTAVAQKQPQPLTAKTANGFVPKGWKLFSKASGDLNKDGKPDLALIIEKVDRRNLIPNESLGADTLNTNPRRLVVAFGENNGYRLTVQNDHFIPTEHSEDAPCLADPLYDMVNKGLSIEGGLLFLNFNYWYSCGTWFVNSEKYTFRWQHNKFELIGLDVSEFHRASLDEKKYSINYSTGIIETTTGGNLSGEEKYQPKTVRKKLKKKFKYDLATITPYMDFGIE